MTDGLEAAVQRAEARAEALRVALARREADLAAAQARAELAEAAAHAIRVALDRETRIRPALEFDLAEAAANYRR